MHELSCIIQPPEPIYQGYTYIPHHPQDEGCHTGQPCHSFMPNPQQACQPRSPPTRLKGVEGPMVGQDSRMVEIQKPRPGITRTFESLQTGPDRVSERQFVANIDEDDPWCRDRRLGSLQRMMSDEDNRSYGIGLDEVEPVDAGIRNNRPGDEDSAQNNGPGDEDSAQNNGPGDGNRVQNNGVGDEDSAQNNGPGDGNRVQNNGPGDGNSTQENGPGDETRVKNNGPGDETRVKNNGPGDETRVKNNGADNGNNGHGNNLTTMPDLTLDDKSSQELDNNDLLAQADWDSFSISGRNFQDKASIASSQSPMVQKITKNEHSSSTLQMANHKTNGKPFKLNPVASDKSASPKSTNYCPTYPNSMPTGDHACPLPPYAYSEYGYPNNEAHPSHQTMQKGYMYHDNGPPQTNQGTPQSYYRNHQGFHQILRGAQNFPGTPQTGHCFPQTIQGANRNVQCFPWNIQGGHFQIASQGPHHYATRRGPPLHAMGRGYQLTQQGVPDARNWQVPHTAEVTPAKKTVPVASDHDQYPHGVPAAARGPRGHPTNPSDRPPPVEDGMVFSEKGQVKLRGQESREASEKRHSDSAVDGEVSPAQQHRRHGSDEGAAACGREAESECREREKYVFITGGDETKQDAVAKEINKLCHELRKLGITVVADLPEKFQAVPRDPLQGRNSISFRRDNVHEARMAYFERATCVLIIVSPGYKAYVDKDNDQAQAQAQPTEHQSSTRHIYTLMLTEYCEKNFSKNKRFYPVCLTKLKTKRSDIPDWISSTLIYYFPGKELFNHLKQDLEND
ncbi:uncharacterized protein LOC124256181 isoform X2 [Haliotis rubra]|uniref:uncharacterized protein LOC124256181 isoform X2 n=1 Tax=Haliotis rubra TaxID=36100 RepID=UPI001EE59266|nr:uncharacterized protein LOC124256181 isoform X2 [Haliotis rubra]